MEYEFFGTWLNYLDRLILPATMATLRMVAVTMIFGSFFGFVMAVMLTLYGPKGLMPHARIYRVLDFIINTIRSFPTLILIVAMIPITRAVVGTIIGEKAAVVPLIIVATALVGRLLENNFKEVNPQIIEAARSFGASNLQIIFKVIIRESIPAMVSSLTFTTIIIISGTTIAGVVGGGGLGSIAINYGYQSFNNSILYTCVAILAIMVIVTEYTGKYLYRRLR
jgi:D-methionine transport system permease protein